MVTTSSKATAEHRRVWTRCSIFVLATGTDKVWHSSCQVGGWSRCKRGWLCQLIPLLTKYLWCVSTRREAPIHFYNNLSVDLFSSLEWSKDFIYIHIVCAMYSQWYSVLIRVRYQVILSSLPLTLLWMVSLTYEMSKTNLSRAKYCFSPCSVLIRIVNLCHDET